ncbi:MAG: amino acid ABC transporter ATP-binding protein [Moraxellaceae bacterium]|nr:amino acid ABC transporter ATP-binding protein [Moraxellaceae bacterium]
MIILKDLNKSFAGKTVLNDINLTFTKGKTTAIIGPSGSGKTTLLRSLNLLEMPCSGSLTIANWQHDFTDDNLPNQKKIVQLRRKLGMVFQSFNLFPHKTIAQNITLGAIVVKKQKASEALILAHELLEKVGLRDKADQYPHELSGGQKQRVAIARALAMQPEVLLFDEPTSALDAELEREVLCVIQQLAKEDNTQIIVTHNLNFAQTVADELLFIENGSVIEFGDCKQIFNNPKQARTQKFLQSFRKADY